MASSTVVREQLSSIRTGCGGRNGDHVGGTVNGSIIDHQYRNIFAVQVCSE